MKAVQRKKEKNTIYILILLSIFLFLSYVVFFGDLISIYLEKNILNLTFEENYVLALAVW